MTLDDVCELETADTSAGFSIPCTSCMPCSTMLSITGSAKVLTWTDFLYNGTKLTPANPATRKITITTAITFPITCDLFQIMYKDLRHIVQ